MTYMCTYFKTRTEEHSIAKILSEKNMGIRGQFLKKRKICLQNLTKEWKQPPVVILQQANFCNIFILCLQIRIIRRSDQGVQHINFPSQIFFKDINHGYKVVLLKKNSLQLLSIYMDVASYCYYGKRVQNECALLKIFCSFSAAELNNIESENDVFAQEFSCEERNF